MMPGCRVRDCPRRFRQKQLEAFNLQAHFLPRRIVEGLKKRFDVLRLDIGHKGSFASEGAAVSNFERRAASSGGKTGSATMNSSPAARAARTPSSEAIAPPRAPRAPLMQIQRVPDRRGIGRRDALSEIDRVSGFRGRRRQDAQRANARLPNHQGSSAIHARSRQAPRSVARRRRPCRSARRP